MSESKKKSKPDPASKPSSNTARRFRWVGFGLLIILLAPSLLTLTGKHRALLQFLQPALESAVEYKSISSHWWAPVEIVDMRVKDLSLKAVNTEAEAVPLATIASLTSVQPLWKLLLSGGRGAEFVIRQPVINVAVRDGHTNVEDTFLRLFGASDAGSKRLLMSVVVEDGTIRLFSTEATDAQDSEAPYTSISGIYAKLSTLNPSLSLPELSMIANVRQLTLQQQQAAAKQQPSTRVAATLNDLSADFPLLPFTEDQLADLRSSNSEPDLQIHVGPSGDDGVQQLTIEARRLQMSQLQVLLQRWLPDAAFRGELSCRIQGHVIGGEITQGLAGRFQLLGNRIGWRNANWAVGESLNLESVTVQGAIALAEDGILVNDLRVNSSVLELVGNGEVRRLQQDPVQALQLATSHRSEADKQVVAEAQAATAGQVKISGSVDLAAISAMLPRTLNLEQGVEARTATLRFSARVQNEVKPAGDVLNSASSKKTFRWQVAAQSSPIEAVRDGRSINIDSACRLDALGNLDIQGYKLETVSLQGAFGKISAEPLDSGYKVSGTINPERLWTDFRDLIDVPRPGLRGEVSFFSRVEQMTDGIQLSRLNLKSSGLELSSPLLNIYPERDALQMCEGTFELQGDSSAVKTLIAPWHSATWLADSSTISARLDADPRQQITVNAVIQNRNQVRPASLYKTISTSTAESAYLVIDQGKLDASFVADQRTGDFLVEKCLIELPGVQAQVKGTMGVRSGLLHVNLVADTTYDLDVLSQRVIDPDGKIALSGRGREEFLVKGSPSLWTEADVLQHQRSSVVVESAATDENTVQMLQATGKVVWTAGRLYGTPIGAGAVVAELKNGLVRSEPIQCTLGGGDLNVMPQWNLESNLLQMASGSRISNLNITQELCREWLGYVAPMLSDSANVDGTVSARVHQFQYFVDNPGSSTIQAVLTIHRGSASPGNSLAPLLQVLSVVGKSDVTNRQLEFPSQDVSVQLSNGMIVHDGLEMSLAGYNIRSAGGVGLDRRVQLVLDVPLEKAASAQAGRSIRIPVGGTVDRPQLDTVGLLQNFGVQQLEGKVNDQLNNGLKKLFNKL